MRGRHSTPEEAAARTAGLVSARLIASTPALRNFLNREDVKYVRFPSGAFHLYVDGRPGSIVGDTLAEIAEKGLQAEAAA